MDISKELIWKKIITWPEVFELWHQNEKDNENWKKLYQQRGYDNWHDWRMSYAGPLGLDKLSWDYYEIIDPIKTVPNYYGGPFTVWKKYYYGDKDTLPYKDLLAEQVLRRIDGKVLKLAENFPKNTNLLGLIHKGRVVIIEGTHRCLAVSWLAKQGRPLNARINIALAQSNLSKLPIVGGTK